MSNHSQAWLIVATREIYVRVTNRTFIISTLRTTVLIAGLAGFSVYQGNKASTSTVVVSNTAANLLVNKANEVAHAVDDKSTIKADHVKNDQAARAALADENADAWLHESDHGWVLTAKKDVDLKVRTAVEESVRSAALSANGAAAGTSVEVLMRGANVTVDRLDGKPDNSAVIKVATVAFSLVFFMAAMMFGIQIATSVVEEKQSRLVEIIATAIPLRHLLAGKVLGNGFLAIAQIVLYGATGLVALSFTEFWLVLPGLTAAVGWFCAFFALGFLALACLYAIGGSIASRVEDLQSTTAPMTMALMAVYFASFGLSGTALTAVSFVPIVSVVAMPARVLAGGVPVWEPIVSLGITAAFAAFVVLIGDRARHSLLQSRGKLSWRAAFRASR